MRDANYMRRMIFHLPYKPDINRASASQIRPFKMIEAFKAAGYLVDKVSGYGKERKGQIKKIKHNIKNNIAYEFLYSESSTMPTLLTESHHLPTYPLLDFDFFEFCKRHGIPIGLFYRDIHWRFPHYDGESKFKGFVANLFYRFDLRQYRQKVDVLFLPSIDMLSYIPELSNKIVCALPPGTCTTSDLNHINTSHIIKILYVGGIGKLYDLHLFLKVLGTISKKYDFTICCRPDDYQRVKEEYQNLPPNVTFVHKKNEELYQLYLQHDICCLFTKPTDYWHFAMPVKLFEYLSFKKPIIAVKDTAVGKFVDENGVGWTATYDYPGLERLLQALTPDAIKSVASVVEAVSMRNTWLTRAKTVANILKDINTN